MRSVLAIVSVIVLLIIVYSCQDDDPSSTVNITGTWVGVGFGYWDVPEHPDAQLTLVLEHNNSTITGRLQADHQVDTLYMGSFHNGQLEFITGQSEYEDIEQYWIGDLKGDRIEGLRSYRRLSNGEVHFTRTWYVEKVP